MWGRFVGSNRGEWTVRGAPLPDHHQPLTLSFVRGVVKPGSYHDGALGLILVVSAAGGKSWVQRLTVNGRRRDIGLGSAHKVSPAEARKAAARNKARVRAGGNPFMDDPGPSEAASEPRRLTFAKFCQDRYRSRAAASEEPSREREAYLLLRNHVHPLLGRLGLGEVRNADVVAALTAVGRNAGPSSVRKALPLLTRVFDEAVREGLIAENPVTGVRYAQVAAPKLTSKHGEARTRRVLAALPAFLKEITASTARPSLLKLVRFTILTARHPQECRLARWAQIDQDAAVWRFPSMQKEGARQIEVPLHDALQELLKEAAALCVPSAGDWVFPNPVRPGEPYGNTAAEKIPARFGYEVNMLDVRRAYEMWSTGLRADASILPEWFAYLQGKQ